MQLSEQQLSFRFPSHIPRIKSSRETKVINKIGSQCVENCKYTDKLCKIKTRTFDLLSPSWYLRVLRDLKKLGGE